MTDVDSFLETVPESTVIRQRIAELIREETMLRKLLKIAEGKEKDRTLRQKRGEAVHVS